MSKSLHDQENDVPGLIGAERPVGVSTWTARERRFVRPLSYVLSRLDLAGGQHPKEGVNVALFVLAMFLVLTASALGYLIIVRRRESLETEKGIAADQKRERKMRRKLEHALHQPPLLGGQPPQPPEPAVGAAPLEESVSPPVAEPEPSNEAAIEDPPPQGDEPAEEVHEVASTIEISE
ncbi:unnamed protein product [Amoebophrya sp. A25]|nr:unnamed protein product [Amoebophrya sp. A25]|eukprot:GSA25T00019114001.1